MSNTGTKDKSIYYNGIIYKGAAVGFKKISNMVVYDGGDKLKKYQVIGLHNFKDGQDVTGMYELGYQWQTESTLPCDECYSKSKRIIAIPTPEPANIKTADDVRNQFEDETGKGWMVIPVTHGENGYASWEYQLWLENKLATTPAAESLVGDKWVSVEDRLPDKGERVFICTDMWVCACCYLNIHSEWKLAYDSSLFHGNITHWQPLPSPPASVNTNT